MATVSDQPPRASSRRAVTCVYIAGMFLSSMDTQIVNVALATISHDFRAPTSSVQWVVVGYVLSLGVFIPASGWAGDRFGTKRTFLCAVGAFTFASALCAASTNLPELVAARVLQGAGGGTMVPVGAAMLYRAYPAAERVAVARQITRVLVLAPAAAPIIGGLIVTHLSWHWIFLVNLPVGVVLVAFGSVALNEHREPRPAGFDLPGLLLGGPGLALLLYAISDGPVSGWSSPAVLATGIAGVTCLAAFVARELSCAHPLLNLDLLRDHPLFRRCCPLYLCSAPAWFGSIVFVSLYVQEARGYSAIVSGLTTFPEAIAIGLSSQVVGRLYPRIGPRRLITGGFIGLFASTLLLSLVGGSTSLWVVRALVFCLGLAVGFVTLPAQAAAYAQISSAETGHATAIFSTFQRTSMAVGVAVLATVLAIGAHNAVRPPVAAFHAVYLAAAGFAALGIILALRISDADAAPTMVRRIPDAKAARTV
jgi:EmrB/QacA subfamily drug resistance transporter